MSIQENKALVRRLIEELWNQGDEAAIERFIAPVLQEPVRQHYVELVEAFSDLRVTIEDIIAEADIVAARLMVSGKHDKGAFAGQPPTGKHVSYGSFRFYRVEAGKIVESWAMQDRLGLLEQLDAVSFAGTDVHWLGGKDD